jgi:hypothetical protein
VSALDDECTVAVAHSLGAARYDVRGWAAANGPARHMSADAHACLRHAGNPLVNRLYRGVDDAAGAAPPSLLLEARLATDPLWTRLRAATPRFVACLGAGAAWAEAAVARQVQCAVAGAGGPV